MKKTVIRTRNLTKTYRLYHNPRYRLLDAFGLLFNQAGKFDTHTALDKINLEICQGEKIAIIGSNGAGKSTLLKLICKVIKPTSGEIEISGNVHPLLEIGTGFIQDFSGRENIYAYLANFGIAGEAADQKFNEIVDFSELEEYIDQPTKTYSTGMKVRLMFATSTAIQPDILVLDEVLSVGDAYFTQKSYNRIRELCSNDSTLLLVTHDIYSVMELCDRFIWIDNGRIQASGSSQEVYYAYANAIREKEETRLRNRRIKSAKKRTENEYTIYGYIKCDQLAGELYISEIRIHSDSKVIAYFKIAGSNYNMQLITNNEEANWGDVVSLDTRSARQYKIYGSIYHKLPFIITINETEVITNENSLDITIDYHSNENNILEICLISDSFPDAFIGELKLNIKDSWKTTTSILNRADKKTINVISGASDKIKRYGTKCIELTDIEFMDNTHKECYIFETGSEMRIRMRYCINNSAINEYPIICATFEKDGITRTHRIWTNKLHLSATQNLTGYIDTIISPIQFCRGTYIISFTVFKEGYFDKNKTLGFFSTSNDIYDFHLCTHEIIITNRDNSPLTNDVLFEHPTSWEINK